jgi:hypothetical protein
LSPLFVDLAPPAKSIIETRAAKEKRLAMDDEAKSFMHTLMGEVTGDLKASFVQLNAKVDLLTTWRPKLESKVAELQLVVGELQRTSLVYQPHVAIDIPAASATVPVDAGKAAAASLGGASGDDPRAIRPRRGSIYSGDTVGVLRIPGRTPGSRSVLGFGLSWFTVFGSESDGFGNTDGRRNTSNSSYGFP